MEANVIDKWSKIKEYSNNYIQYGYWDRPPYGVPFELYDDVNKLMRQAEYLKLDHIIDDIEYTIQIIQIHISWKNTRPNEKKLYPIKPLSVDHIVEACYVLKIDPEELKLDPDVKQFNSTCKYSTSDSDFYKKYYTKLGSYGQIQDIYGNMDHTMREKIVNYVPEM
jgi:hypothetical protein